MDKVELKPCGNCAGKAIIVKIGGKIGAHVMCEGCGIFGPDMPSIGSAVNAWNTRPDATIEALQAQVAAKDAVLVRAEKWLRACSDWLLETDLDMKCPDTMDEDPLDIANDIAALGQGEG